MGIFDKLFGKKSKDLEVKNKDIEKGGVKKINDGLNTPDKIYLESYGLNGAEVHFNRGYEALARNDLENALLEFKYAVIAYPEHEGSLRYLRGDMLGPLNVKRTTKAQSLFDEGMALLERKEYEQAISCFDKAINLCPIAAVASFCFRGKAFLATGRYQEAIDDFSISLQYSPKIAEGYYDRGQAYLKLGMKSEAKKEFEMAIKLDPRYEDAKKMFQGEGVHSSKEHSSRWYFLSLGWAMALQVFQALCQDEEFTSVDAGSAVPEAKVLVRYYRAYDPWGPEQPPYRPEEAEELDIVFRGFAFPLSPKELPKKMDGLNNAYLHLGGLAPSGTSEVPVMVILADTRFDTLMRGYHNLLNNLYMQKGALPIVKLIYTDDFKSAKNLVLLYQLKEKSTRHEGRFNVWCTKKGIAPETFSGMK